MLSENELEAAIQGREAALVAAIGDRAYNGVALLRQFYQDRGPGQYTTEGFAIWLCNNYPGWVDEWVTAQPTPTPPPRGSR